MDDNPKIIVTLGSAKHTIPYCDGMTFLQLRTRVAESSGLDGNTFRFLYKGRKVQDSDLLIPANSTSPALLKVMALRTKSYHESQSKGSSSRGSSTGIGLADALEDATAKERTIQITTSKPSTPKGDEIPNDANFVVVRMGAARYHVLTEHIVTIGELKERLEGMDGIDIEKKEMNLIFKGSKCSSDELRLDVLGVKRGSMLMLLARAGHHDAIDARAELGKIRTSLIRLETRAKKLQREIARRLVDDAAIRARLGELDDETMVLKDQLGHNQTDEQAKKEANKCLDRTEQILDELRDNLS